MKSSTNVLTFERTDHSIMMMAIAHLVDDISANKNISYYVTEQEIDPELLQQFLSMDMQTALCLMKSCKVQVSFNIDNAIEIMQRNAIILQEQKKVEWLIKNHANNSMIEEILPDNVSSKGKATWRRGLGVLPNKPGRRSCEIEPLLQRKIYDKWLILKSNTYLSPFDCIKILSETFSNQSLPELWNLIQRK